MSNAKYTRGPWSASGPIADGQGVVGIEIGADTPGGHMSVAWVLLGTKPTPMELRDGRADAQLLAAAPELREAAAGLLQLIGPGEGGPFEPNVAGTYNERVAALFAAVAKAEVPRG